MFGGEGVVALAELVAAFGTGVAEIPQNEVYLGSGGTLQPHTDAFTFFISNTGWVLEAGVTGNLEPTSHFTHREVGPELPIAVICFLFAGGAVEF